MAETTEKRQTVKMVPNPLPPEEIYADGVSTIVADFSITFDNVTLTAGDFGTFTDAQLQALGIDVGTL